MKDHYKLHLTFTLLLLLSATIAQGAIQSQIPFEKEIPSFFSTSSGSDISLSDLRYKDGKHSLHWSWQRASQLIYSDAETLSKSFACQKAGIMLWIYNPKAVEDNLRFEFENASNEVVRHFDFHLNFTGWRACWIKYGDMPGDKEMDTSKIARMRISTPQSLPKGEIWLDRMTCSFKRLNEQITADQQIPNNNCNLQRSPWHWVRLWEWEQYTHDMPLTPASKEDLEQLRIVEKRLDELIEEQSPNLKQLARKLIPEAEEKFLEADIHRNKQGAWVGAPLLSKDEHNPKRGELQNADIDQMLYAFGADAYYNNNPESEERFFLVMDYAIDQGFAYGSGQGTNHHYGYNTRKIFHAMWQMRHRLKGMDKEEEYIKVLTYWSGLQECRQPYKYGRDELLDTWHTLLQPKLICAMLATDTDVRLRNLKELSRWISGSLAFTPGTIGGIKTDGTTFHHGGFYPAYSVGAFAALGEFLRATNDTSFALEKSGRKNLKHALLTLSTYTADRDWGLGISGRHPFGKNGHIPYPDIDTFGYLALAGDLTDSGLEFDPELASTYLRLRGNNDLLTDKFTKAGISACKCPEGFFAYNYGCVGIHRRGDWVATLKAYNSDVWCSEIYTHDNRYGRYQSYGTVQICATGSPANAYDSGFSQAGWDWNRPPASTTIHLPYDELESPRKGTHMERNSQRFSGVTSFEGQHGAMAFQFVERDIERFTAGATAHKSVFAFDNRLIFLGSGITNENEDYPTETTLFQLRLDEEDEPVYINSKAYDEFPLDKSIRGDRIVVQDTKDILYIVKGAEEVKVLKQTQTSPNDKNHRPQTDNFASAYISHGISPKEARYEYMAVIRPTDTDRKEATEGNLYEVLSNNNQVHAVKDIPTGILAYVCWTDYEGEGILKSIEKETMLMYRSTDVHGLKMSVCTPDLGITKKAYTTRQPSQEILKEVVLRGHWQMEATQPQVEIEVAPDHATTLLRVHCIEGQPVEMSLRMVE